MAKTQTICVLSHSTKRANIYWALAARWVKFKMLLSHSSLIISVTNNLFIIEMRKIIAKLDRIDSMPRITDPVNTPGSEARFF